MRLSRVRLWSGVAAALVIVLACASWAQGGGKQDGGKQDRRRADWRVATDAELHSVIPARAPVVTERIETEMRSASGITNGRGKYIAGVVLITAGYSAEGKYSHFLVTQVPLRLGTDVRLAPGEYLLGYEHSEDGLLVRIFEASSGKPLGSVMAKRIPGNTRVESFRIWPPADRSLMQIGRFGFTYQIGS